MIKRIIFSLSLLMLGILAVPQPARAWDIFAGADCGKNGDSAICQGKTSGDPLTGPNGALIHVVNIISIVAGMAAIIVMIVGGIYFMTANGDSNNITNARNTILNAIIGLIIIVIARSLIVFVVRRI